MDALDHRTFDTDRVVLLGPGAKTFQVIFGKVDAADESDPPIDDDDLAMQPAQRLQFANERCRLINMQPHASVGQSRDEVARQIGRAETVDRQVNFDTTGGGIDQVLLKVATHAILEQDEGLDHDFSLGRIDRIEDGWEVCVAVLEQLDAVAADPFELELHSRTSPASGA